MKKGNKRIISLILLVCLLAGSTLTLTGCGGQGDQIAGGDAGELRAEGAESTDDVVELTADVSGTPRLEGKVWRDFVGEEDNLTDVSVKLFQQIIGEQGEESMVTSPLSTLLALAMTAQGARGETRAELESFYGRDIDYLCAFLYGYQQRLLERDGAVLSVANSLWIRDNADRFQAEEQFLIDAKAYFAAQVYKSAFDEETVEAMNSWCSEKTDGMIEKLMDEISPNDVMHLLNVLCFDGKWKEPFESYAVGKLDFQTPSGKKQPVEAMFGEAPLYIADKQATGFIKSYEGGYDFVALLPEKGVSVTDYARSLTGEHFLELVRKASEESVRIALPKFTSQYEADMGKALQHMGLRQLFDEEKADLGGMGTSTRGNVYISRVLQKAFLSVDTEGTRAAAATDVAAADKAMLEMKEVLLDRPFLYAIIDSESGVPVFMGVYAG